MQSQVQLQVQFLRRRRLSDMSSGQGTTLINRKRVVVNTALALCLTIAGVGTYRATRTETVAATSNDKVETVSKRDVVSTVSASGNIESAVSTELSFAQAGTVTEVLVKQGERVKVGDVLARVDDDAQQTALSSAKAALQSAQAKAAKTRSGLSVSERAQNAASAAQSAQSINSAEVALTNARASADANKTSYQLAIDQAAAALDAARTALTTAEDKANSDNTAAQSSVDSARTSLDTARTSAAHDNAVSQASVDSAQATLDEAKNQLTQFRSNLDVAQRSFDTKTSVGTLSWIDTVSRYTDAQTYCKDKGVTTYDDVTCSQVGYLLSLAQSGQKQESTVTQANTSLNTARNNQVSTTQKGTNSITSAQTTLTNALNSQKTTKSSGAQSVTNAQDKIVSAQNSLDNAKNSQRTGLLKDAQSVKTAEESRASAQRGYDVQVAGNKVKEKPATADQLAADQSSVASAQDQLRKAQNNLDDTVLRAPFDATVASINGAVGDNVGTGSKAFITLTDPDLMRVKVGFSEADALQIKVGQPATVTMDASPDRIFTGTVTSLDPTQTSVNNVVTYYAKVDLVGDLEGVRPGMSASVDVRTDERKGVLTLPSSEVKGSSSTATVRVRTTSKAADGKTTTTDSPTQIIVGLRGDSSVEIKSGLSEGQQVVVESSGGSLPAGIQLPAGRPGGGLGGGL